MAMTLDQARQAIITRAMVFTGIEQSRIKYPNKDFTVPVDGLWCEINVLWAVQSLQQLVIHHVQDVRGLSQLTAWLV